MLKYLKIAYLTKHMELRSKTTCLSKNNLDTTDELVRDISDVVYRKVI
jgi:hypothetical protein